MSLIIIAVGVSAPKLLVRAKFNEELFDTCLIYIAQCRPDSSPSKTTQLELIPLSSPERNDHDIFPSYSFKRTCYWWRSSPSAAAQTPQKPKTFTRYLMNSCKIKLHTQRHWAGHSVSKCFSIVLHLLWPFVRKWLFWKRSWAGKWRKWFSAAPGLPELLMGRINCLKGSSGHLRGGWRGSKLMELFGETAEQHHHAEVLGDQMNRINSPGELTP